MTGVHYFGGAVTATRDIYDAMATPSKRIPALKGEQSLKLPSRRSAPSKPFLRFYHSESLREKTLSLLSSLEQAQDATKHRNALASLIVELTNSGMEYYFMKPLKLAKAGFIVEQTANLGLGGVQRVMGLSSIRSLAVWMAHN